jgi:hypothetical protein
MIYLLIPATIGFFLMWRLSEYELKRLKAIYVDKNKNV